MVASAVFILDPKGKIIIARNYRGDIPMNCVETFSRLILDEEEACPHPVFEANGVSYVYIKHTNVYLVAVTQRNSNAALLLTLLYHFVGVFKEYLRELEEESIRDNFVIVYELLDEMVDFGYPQVTDSRILQEYIVQESNKLVAVPKPPPAVTGAVSWRSEGISYRKNEVFLDVVESVNLLVAANGTPIRSEILGQLKMRSCVRARAPPNPRSGRAHCCFWQVLERHARAEVGPERQAAVRGARPCCHQGKEHRDGRHQVSPVRFLTVCPWFHSLTHSRLQMRASRALRRRSHHLLHPPRRRIRAYVRQRARRLAHRLRNALAAHVLPAVDRRAPPHMDRGCG